MILFGSFRCVLIKESLFLFRLLRFFVRICHAGMFRKCPKVTSFFFFFGPLSLRTFNKFHKFCYNQFEEVG